MIRTNIDRPTTNKREPKRIEKIDPLEKKFKNLYSKIQDAIKTAENLELKIDSTHASALTLETTPPDVKSSLVNQAEFLARRHQKLKENIVSDLELLVDLNNSSAFADHNESVIAARISKFEKELELLKKSWHLSTIHRDLRGKSLSEPTAEQRDIYRTIKPFVQNFASYFEGSPFENDAHQLMKSATEIRKQPQIKDLLLQAEEISKKAQQYYQDPSDKARIDQLIKTLATQLNQAEELEASRMRSFNEKHTASQLKPVDHYLEHTSELEDDLDEFLKEFAYALPNQPNKKDNIIDNLEIIAIQKLGNDFVEAKTRPEKKSIFKELSDRLYKYKTPDAVIPPQEQKLAYFTLEETEQYLAEPNVFIREVEDQLHEINLETSSVGTVPDALYDEYHSIIKESEKINSENFTRNDRYELIQKVDALIYQYTIASAFLYLEDEATDESYESYLDKSITLAVNSVFEVTDINTLPQYLQDQITKIKEASTKCDPLSSSDERRTCLASIFDQIDELHQNLLKAPESEKVYAQLYEYLGYQPTKEHPPQLKLDLSNPEEIEKLTSLLIDWLVYEYDFDGKRNLIEPYFVNPLNNIRSISETGVYIKTVKGIQMKETIPESKRHQIIRLQIRNLNKGVSRFIENQSPEKESENFVQYADLGELNKETGLYTSEIGKGSDKLPLDFDKDFPKVDPLNYILSLDFDKNSSKLEESKEVAREQWDSKTALIKKKLLFQLPSIATPDEVEELTEKLLQWENYTQEMLNRILEKDYSASEIHEFLKKQVERIENEFSNYDIETLETKWTTMFDEKVNVINSTQITQLPDSARDQLTERINKAYAVALAYVEDSVYEAKKATSLESIDTINTEMERKVAAFANALFEIAKEIVELPREKTDEEKTEDIIEDADNSLQVIVGNYSETKSFTSQQLTEIKQTLYNYARTKTLLENAYENDSAKKPSPQDSQEALNRLIDRLETQLAAGTIPSNEPTAQTTSLAPTEVASMVTEASTKTEPEVTKQMQVASELKIQSIRDQFSSLANIPPRMKQALMRRELDLSSEASKKLYFNTALEAFSHSTGIDLSSIPTLKNVPLASLQAWSALKDLSELTGIDLATHVYEKPVTSKTGRKKST